MDSRSNLKKYRNQLQTTGARVAQSHTPSRPQARPTNLPPAGNAPVPQPSAPPSQLTLQPVLALIQGQQTNILTHIANSDKTLHVLVGEVGKLREIVVQRQDDAKERDAKDKANEERESQYLKALTILAQRLDDVKKVVVGIETVVGVNSAQGGGNATMLDRLQNIEMDVEEWLERVRDPDAAASDRRGSVLPPSPSSLPPAVPAVVRHEMAVSPVKVSFTSCAVSTRTESAKVDVSTQVDIPDEPYPKQIIVQEASENVLPRIARSNRKASPTPHTPTNDVDMCNSPASVSSKGKEVDKSSLQDDMVLDISQLGFSAGTAQASQTNMATTTPTTTHSTCKHSDLRKTGPVQLGSTNSIGSLSAVDWSNAELETAFPAVEIPSLPDSVSFTSSKSYTIPPLPEGTVAALRKEAFVDPHPYPLESTALSDANRSVLAGVIGASAEAAERMLSPESQSDGEPVGDDDIPSGSIAPEVHDLQDTDPFMDSFVPESDPLDAWPQMSSQSDTQAVSTSQMAKISWRHSLNSNAKKRRSASLSTVSSLTSLSSDASNVASHTENGQQARPSFSSKTADIAEDEDVVMSLVMDMPPTSPATTPPSPTTLSQFLRAASPVTLLTPPPAGSGSMEWDSPENDDHGSQSLKRLQEWYLEQQLKVSNNQEIASVIPSSRDISPDVKTGVAGIDESPLFTSAGESPPSPASIYLAAGPSMSLKKLVESLEDDDTDVVPAKRIRKPTSMSKSGSAPRSARVKRTSIPSPPPKRLLVQKKGQSSKAKTRIKRRKASQSPAEMGSEQEEDAPPLKRIRLRLRNKSNGGPVSSAPQSMSVTPVKTPTKRLLRAATVVWPTIDKPVFDQFVECDTCDRWYHLGCAGVSPDDIRLSATEIYQCPPCEAGIAKDPNSSTTRAGDDDAACARPKCLCPRRTTSSIKKEATFVVEGFVGMVKKAVGGRGIKRVYLVKWLGYGLEEATWEEEQAMGLPSPGFFIDKFERAAHREGLDLTQCNAEAALLKCALEAGWNSSGLLIKKE